MRTRYDKFHQYKIDDQIKELPNDNTALKKQNNIKSIRGILKEENLFNYYQTVCKG